MACCVDVTTGSAPRLSGEIRFASNSREALAAASPSAPYLHRRLLGSAALARETNCVSLRKRSAHLTAALKASVEAQGDNLTTVPGYPEKIFPETAWAWHKAPPKASLYHLTPIPQDRNAAQWILNLIELIHWASFPLGFHVAYYVFRHAGDIVPHLGAGMDGVFLILLGLLSQVFGGGISGNMMHEYEGWQVTPFRNPLGLPQNPDKENVDALRVPDFNNAWLRAVAYQMLFSFQAFGLSCFTTAVFGVNLWTSSLVLGTVLIALLGPKEPRAQFSRRVGGEDRPYLPLSWSLIAVFGVNLFANLAANAALFHSAAEGSVKPWLGEPTAAVAGYVLSLLGPTMIGLGGAVEGYFAETSFNQWHHFIAFVILTAGLAVTGVTYSLLVA